MNTKYLLPAGIAAGIHAILLLGFNSPAPPPALAASRAAPGDEPRRVIELSPPEPDETEIFTPRPGEKPAKPQAVPGGLDLPPPTIDPRGPVQMIQPSVGPINAGPLTTIPVAWGTAGGSVDGSGFGRGLVDGDFLDNVPQARVQPAPLYPYNGRGRTATVAVELIVGVDGRVVHARVVRSSDPDFETPCLNAVLRWEFEPGRKHGVVVPFRMVQPFTFELRD